VIHVVDTMYMQRLRNIFFLKHATGLRIIPLLEESKRTNTTHTKKTQIVTRKRTRPRPDKANTLLTEHLSRQELSDWLLGEYP
jgi:hypothetical protein